MIVFVNEAVLKMLILEPASKPSESDYAISLAKRVDTTD